MPRLVLTYTNGKERSVKLVSTSNTRRPNEVETRLLDQINRRLPPQILTEMSVRGVTIPSREIGLLLSRLKAATDLNVSIGD